MAPTTSSCSRKINYDDDELSDIKALAAIEQENSRSRRKYGNRFNVDDDELLDEEDGVDDGVDDGVGGGNGSDEAQSYMLLAERTSQILNSFQEYVSGIGVDDNDERVCLIRV